MSTPTNTETATAKRRGPPKADERIAPVITALAADVPVPAIAVKQRRGIKSQYPFADLEIGQSFGVTNKSYKQIMSVVSAVNRKHLVEKRDENGNVMTIALKARDANGKLVETAGRKSIMVPSKRFVCAEVNPKTDPAKASVRVWRVALDK